MVSFTDFEYDTRTLVLGAVGVVVTAAVAYALYTYLAALVFAIFGYYASRPVYRRLNEHTEHPDLAVTVTILMYTIPVIIVLGYGAYVAVNQISRMFSHGALQQFRAMVGPALTLFDGSEAATLQAFLQNPRAIIDQTTRQLLRRGIDPLITVLTTLFSLLAQAFLMTVFLFYMLRDDQKISRWFRDVVNHDSAILGYAEGVDEKLGTVFFGNLLTIVVTSAIAITVYWALNLLAPPGGGIAVPFLLGAITGLGTLIPGVGMKLIYVPYTLFLIYEALTSPAMPRWFPIAFFVVTLIFVDTIPDYFVRSYLSAGSMTLGLVMLGYILGTMVWGWTGLFLGPILLVLFLQFAQDVLPALTSGRLTR